jgi:hypothetical protein
MRTLFTHTDESITGSGDTEDGYTDTLPGGTLSADNPVVIAEYVATIDNGNALTLQVRMYFGGQQIFQNNTIASAADGNSIFTLRATIIWVSDSEAKCICEVTAGDPIAVLLNYADLTIDLTQDQDLFFNAENDDEDNAITFKMGLGISQ